MNFRLTYLMACAFLVLCSCTHTEYISADEYKPDASIMVGDIVRVKPLRNPDRGLHVECNYFVHNYVNPFNPAEVYPNGFVNQRVDKFEATADDLTLTQLYLYLTDYLNKDIPQSGFDKMQVIFDDLKARGYKAILRFAYNHTGMGTSGGETAEGIKRHLQQLKPFILKNIGQIAVWQAGFIGAWGEWHNSPLSDNQDAKNMLVNELFNIIPEGYMIQLRQPDLKNALTLTSPERKKYIGFNNDFFTAGEHELAALNDFIPGDKWYKQATNESSSFFMSGELPYAENSKFGLKVPVSINTTLKIMRDHHYSAFDLTQNYEINIANWKQYKLYPELLSALNVLYDETYFKNEEGKPVARSAYDFIRDHLGYRLNMKQVDLKIQGNKLNYSLEFTNTGFAAPLNPREVYLAFVNQAGVVVKTIKLDAIPSKWQPFDPSTSSYSLLVHKMEGNIEVGLTGEHTVGLWMPDGIENLKYSAIYDVKWVENKKMTHWSDSENKYAINVLGRISF